MADQLPPWEDDRSDWVTASGRQSAALGHELDQGANNALARAYAAGEDGLPALDAWGDDEREAWGAGRSDAAAKRAATAPARSAPPARPSRLVPSRHGIASFVLGAVVSALVLAYLEYGPEGPKSWVAAKFWNSPTLTAANTKAAATNAKGAPTQAAGS